VREVATQICGLDPAHVDRLEAEGVFE